MRRLFLFLVTLAVSTACTTTVPLSGGDDESWVQHQQQVSQLQYWTLNGRLAVNNGNESWHLDLFWQQQGDDYLIKLAGPLGAGQIKLHGNRDGVTLEDGENLPRFAVDADSLLYDNTGLKIPVMGMRFWVRGLPDPSMSNGHLNLFAGRLKQLWQGGWQLQFRGYQQVNGTTLPQKLFMRRHDLDVRLVIDEWRLGLPSS
jgi:outer membrane lipoprotein LolB